MRLSRRRLGFTLVELLVVIAIIGILVALLLPAVQAAREAARRAQCTNNLKQLGLSIHNYHDTHKAIVAGADSRWLRGRAGEISGLVRLLPYLEQNALYDIWTSDWGVAYQAGHPRNNVQVPTIVCPSDTPIPWVSTNTPDYDKIGQKSYYFCYGTTIANNHDGPTDGMFQVSEYSHPKWGSADNPYLRFGDIQDGLSNTIAMSEKAAGGMRGSSDDQNREVKGNVVVGTTLDPNVCLTYEGPQGEYIPGPSTNNLGCGALWAQGHPHFNAFVTVLSPNGPSCSSHGSMNLSFAPGIFTASSRHPAGLNVLMGDGSTQFVSETINAVGGKSGYGLWGALGTRSGKESASLD